jgi:hypothetical protein
MTVINYGSQMAAANAKAAAEKQEAQNQEVWRWVLDKYLLAEVDANYRVLRDFSSGQMTIESCEYLIKSRVHTLAWTTRAALVDEIAELLRDNTTDKVLTAWGHRQYVTWMSAWSLPKLRAYRRELHFKYGHRSATAAREFIAGVRASEVPPERVLPPEITAARIKAMRPDEIRRLVRDWTAPVVNNRLFGRS